VSDALEEAIMNPDDINVKLTLRLNGTWASDYSDKELVDYLRQRIDTVLGFRGEVHRVTVASR
jgi:hypothetical protein